MISPDFLTDVQLTIEAHKICANLFDCEVAGNVVGNTIEEMEDCYRKYLLIGTEIICLPFRLDRIRLVEVLKVKGDWDDSKWYHWLGLKSMDELKQIKEFGLEHQSIDTSKPIKAALANKTLFSDLRGLGKIDLNTTMSKDEVDRCRFMMDRFREECVR